MPKRNRILKPLRILCSFNLFCRITCLDFVFPMLRKVNFNFRGSRETQRCFRVFPKRQGLIKKKEKTWKGSKRVALKIVHHSNTAKRNAPLLKNFDQCSHESTSAFSLNSRYYSNCCSTKGHLLLVPLSVVHNPYNIISLC